MADKKVYLSADCDPALLAGKQVIVVGYGSQGRAYSLNLRDSGVQVKVALREKSELRLLAQEEGLEVVRPEQAAAADVVILAIPDHVQPGFYQQYLTALDGKDKTLVFLHGLNVTFENIKFANNQDVILIAPHGPGTDVRDKYVAGSGITCFLAVGQDASGHARDIGLALADAIGSGRVGIYETTFADETIGDLFGEQSLLVGGLAGLTMSAFDKLVEQGLDPAYAYLETVAQLRLLVGMIEKFGPAGMMDRVSRTASTGSLMAMLLMFNEEFDQRLHKIYEFIATGEFNRFLQREAASGFAKSEEMLQILRDDDCQRTVERLNKNRRNK
jgi:ketol-acid reductoisomerase